MTQYSNSENQFITGWDIGGAHLKVARCNDKGEVVNVIQLACPLWQGINHLEQVVQSVLAQLNNQHDLMAITMTGELVDLFPDRKSGVTEIIDCINSLIPAQQNHVFAGQKGWLSTDDAKTHWLDVASRNWQASAYYVADKVNNGLFIDLGSTTCDIIPIVNGQAVPSGYTDQQRQTSRELLYTGTIRTPLIALCQSAPFNGELISLAAEVFATTGDVWCLLRQIDGHNIQDSSADGQAWSERNCAQRLARLLGADYSDAEHSHWLGLAKWFAQQQKQLINNAILHVLSAHPNLNNKPIIIAGIGRSIIKQCAVELGHESIDFSSLVSPVSTLAADHAPAVAVALLASQQLT